MIKWFVPEDAACYSEDDMFQSWRMHGCLKPFAAETLDFLNQLSKEILMSPTIRAYPEFAAAAHWFRKSKTLEMKREYEQIFQARIRKPRGTVFHIAPSNVDSLFLYSWVLSLLCGNRNIVRLSQKQSESNGFAVRIIQKLLKEDRFREIAVRNWFLTFPHDADLFIKISEMTHVRIIWGGDETVRTIRKIPLAVNGIEMVFPDRYSMALFDAEKIVECSEQTRLDFANSFYNDAFWFDQMACSSPREIIWVGTKEHCAQAKILFWETINEVLRGKDYQLGVAHGVTRLATAHFMAVSDEVTKWQAGATIHEPVRIEVNGEDLGIRTMHCGRGLFLEKEFSHILDVLPHLREKDQTISYFGFSKSQLLELIEKIDTRAVDRVVPVGAALQFQDVWDGYHFIHFLTREIDFQFS